MTDDGVNRLLMSDELRGVVPLLEEEAVSRYSNSYIVAGFNLIVDDQPHVFSGLVVGMSNEASVFKLDVRASISDAYDILKKTFTGVVKCESFLLYYDTEDFTLSGPFDVVNPKIMDFDRDNKMCTLGLDLVRS